MREEIKMFDEYIRFDVTCQTIYTRSFVTPHRYQKFPEWHPCVIPWPSACLGLLAHAALALVMKSVDIEEYGIHNRDPLIHPAAGNWRCPTSKPRWEWHLLPEVAHSHALIITCISLLMISRIIGTIGCEPWIWLWWPYSEPRTDYLHTCHLFPSHTQRKYGSDELDYWGRSVHMRWRWAPNPDWFHVKAPMLNSCIFLPSGKLAHRFETSSKRSFLPGLFEGKILSTVQKPSIPTSALRLPCLWLQEWRVDAETGCLEWPCPETLSLLWVVETGKRIHIFECLPYAS